MLQRCSIFTLQLLRCASPRFPWRSFPASLPATGVGRWPSAKRLAEFDWTRRTNKNRPATASRFTAWSERGAVSWFPLLCRCPSDSCFRNTVWRSALRLSWIGGAEEARTPDIRLAKAALSQLSYGPSGCPVSHGLAAVATGLSRPEWMVGHSGLEPETSVLSGLRSNQLS